MKAVAFLFYLIPAVVFADGIPFDSEKGCVNVPHETFVLTESQRHEIRTHHRLTLTLPQRTRLAEHCSTFPKTIQEILPYDWGDCTCLVGHPYAIVLPGNTSFAVTLDEVDRVSHYGVQRSYMPKPESGWSRFWKRLRSGNS